MSDKISRKLQKEFNVANPIYNETRVAKISKQLKLPPWWVLFVIIEYLPCRRFVENGKAVVFDFGILTKPRYHPLTNIESFQLAAIYFKM